VFNIGQARIFFDILLKITINFSLKKFHKNIREKYLRTTIENSNVLIKVLKG